MLTARIIRVLSRIDRGVDRGSGGVFGVWEVPADGADDVMNFSF